MTSRADRTLQLATIIQRRPMNDTRIYNKQMIYWQGDGTYYFILKLCLWCRALCTETLDFEMLRGTAMVYVKQSETTL